MANGIWDVESDYGGIWGDDSGGGVGGSGLVGDVSSFLSGLSDTPGLPQLIGTTYTPTYQYSPSPAMAMPVRMTIPPIVLSALAKIRAALQRRNITTAAALSLARKIGIPGLIALGLTMAEIAGLMLWGQKHGRRRMNVLNPKALSRSTRRLLGFERRAAKVSAALGRLGRGRRGRRPGRGGRCVTCRQAPCVC